MATTTTYKGLHSDFSPERQPKDTYRFALNATVESAEGELTELTNEKGNQLCVEPPYTVIGHILLNDGRVVLFSTDNTDSEIGIQNKDCTYETLVNTPCLNFSTSHLIQAETKVRKGCNDVIYFTDDYNPVRVIDLNDLDAIKTSGAFDCDKMKLFSDFTYPQLQNLEVLDTGGVNQVGVYQFSVRYSDGNLSGTQYSVPTNPVPLVEERFTGLNDVDGGTFTVDGNCTKSVRLTFTDVDERFDFLEIVVIRTVDGVQSAYRVATLEINDSTINYLYTGIDANTDVQLDVQDVATETVVYEKAKTITQIDKRLILGNLTEKEVDFASLQQAANDIQVTYVTKALPAFNLEASAKREQWYIDNRSYMRDEIYALGIEFIYDDGYVSPAMHIPGREKNFTASGSFITPGTDLSSSHRPGMVTTWDGDTVTDADEIAHIDGVTEAEKWQVYNTALRTQAPSYSSDYYTKGELAYYETETDYPNVTDCNGNRIYPTGKIRHHKMPDTSVEEHFSYTSPDDNTYIHPLGLEFANITYPTTDIVGHRIVYVKRDETTKTVLDKGIIYHNIKVPQSNTPDPDYAITQCAQFNQGLPYAFIAGGVSQETMLDNFSFHGPQHKFRNAEIQSNYLKTDLLVKGTADIYSGGAADKWASAIYYADNSSLSSGYAYNSNINTIAKIAPDTNYDDTLFGLPFLNGTGQDTIGIEIDRPLTDTTTPNTAALVNGDGYWTTDYITPQGISQAIYSTLKRYAPDLYSDLTSLIYYRTTSDVSNGDGIVFGGDSFIGRLGFRKTNYVDFPSDTRLWGEAPIFWVESDINVDLRHSEDDLDLAKQFIPKHTQTSDDMTEFLEQEYTVENHYRYNESFSAINEINVNFPVELAYDYCSDCSNNYPYRVAFSQVGFFESKNDPYKIFLANDYKDIQASRGEVTNMFINKNNLYIHTEESLWFQPTQEQQLKSDEATLYVGSGAFFANKEVEVISTDSGYAGSNNQWATVTHEHGTTFVSDNKIFQFGEGVQEISNTGLRSFLSENIPFTLPTQFKSLVGIEYPHQDNPVRGVGFISTYDERYKRLIITKKDYELLDGVYYGKLSELPQVEEDLGGDNAAPYVGKLIWNESNEKFQLATGVQFIGGESFPTLENVTFDDKTYFRNLSWTLSYSFINQSWASFHSYLPSYMYSNYDNWFTDNGGIYKQDAGDYQTYYGTTYPFIADLVFTESPLQTFVTDSIEYTSNIQEYDSNTRQFRDVDGYTFDKILFYNDYQCSGLLDVVVNPVNSFGTTLTTGEINATRAERSWRVNKIVDLAIPGRTIFSADWADADFKNSYPIDKVVNDNAVDLNRNQFEQKWFRDKYIGMRAYYYNDNKNKINLKITTSKGRPSPR